MSTAAPPRRVRVLIADDEPIMRDVARLACEEQGLDVIGEAGTGLEAVVLTLELRPDVLVLDLDLRDIDGFEVSRRLRQAGCPTRVLGTTGEGGPGAVLRALRFGIAGVLDKMGMGPGLRRALAALATDRGAFTADQQDEALDEFELFLQRSRDRGRLRASMTRREREVAALIAAGLTTRQMASRLGPAGGPGDRHTPPAARTAR